MSKIDKLSIQGIRSFGPQNRETIQFQTPVTLIVGYNGSGKTTIIECLKYATTGELPPNSKGGAFIHDPKLCGEKEVMGQVRLAFYGSTGERRVVTRSIQLTVKRTARSQKTLEGSLVLMNNGEKTTLSSRVADLDEQVPQLLGVSPAILDSVIFCHQDESLWPMSEPSMLKKRFDEIFEAMRYTKAIENLKQLRKKQGEELARLRIFEDRDRIDMEKGKKVEQRCLELQAEIEEDRATCDEMNAELKNTQEQIKLKRQEANSFLTIVQDLKAKRDQLEIRQDAVDEVRLTLEELPGDDASLELSLAQYEDRMAASTAQVEENKTQYNQLQRELATSRRDLATKLSEQGRHQSDKERYDRQLASRAEMIREAARLHGFRGYDGDLGDSQVKSFHDRLQKLLAEKRRDVERLSKENAAEADKATEVVSKLEGRKNARIQDRLSAKQRIAAIDRRVAVLQKDLTGLSVDEGSSAFLQTEMEDVEARRTRAAKELEAGQFDAQLQQENERLWQLEKESERLGRELVECTRMASERAQLDLRKQEGIDRRRKLEALITTWRDKFDAIVGAGWQPETLEAGFQNALKGQNKIVAEARAKRDLAREKLQALEYQVKSGRQACQKKAEEAARAKAVVVKTLLAFKAHTTVDDYLTELSTLEAEVEGMREEMRLWDELGKYYDKAKRTLDKKNKCLMCDRSFPTDDPKSRVYLVDKIAQYLNPEDKKETALELERSRESLDALKMVRGQFDAYTRLSGELPAAREEAASMESERVAHERTLEDLDGEVAVAEEKLQDMEGMTKPAMTVAQTLKDIKDAEAQIERIQSQQMSGVAGRSAEEIHELQATSSEQMRGVKAKINKLSSDRQRTRDLIASLDLEKSELGKKMDHAQRQVEKKRDIEGQIQNFREESMEQRDVMQKADEDLAVVEPQIAESRASRDDVVERGRTRERAAAEERDTVAGSVNELRMIEGDIQAYLDRGGPSNLGSNQRAIDNLEKSLARTEKEITDLTVQTNSLMKDMEDGQRKKKNIHDNLVYRKNLRIVDALRGDIETLESRNADEDYDRIMGEVTVKESFYGKILAKRDELMGSVAAKDQELARLIDEYDNEYKNSTRKYREAHIKVETTKAAIEDLGRYGSALDKAIMQYHSLKMEEVNRIAGELWRDTYQGSDIDTILIRSDAETATGKRNYNYRVCMVKQDTEMDMRGRCSAGQKVLASIIIRLALAESFGVNCGLIALDEPTTNLDSDNIASLAKSLHKIIRARQAQSNLQLIVITHDEEFLRHMRCSDFTDSYYRVKRSDRQTSVIVRESIMKLI